MSNLRYAPPTRLAVDRWRMALEAVACGPVEGVWDGLKPVITEMRLVLGWTRYPDEPYCDWCGRAIKQQDGKWVAVKGTERGYDPVPCDANTDDGTHEPAMNSA